MITTLVLIIVVTIVIFSAAMKITPKAYEFMPKVILFIQLLWVLVIFLVLAKTLGI